MSVLFFAAALGAGWYAYEAGAKSIAVSMAFGRGLAATPEAGETWAKLGALSDVFKILGFAIAKTMWDLRQRGLAVFVTLTWALTVSYGLNAGAGFASRNMADAGAKNAALLQQRRDLDADIARKQAIVDQSHRERPGLRAAAIAGDLSRAEAAVERGAWRRTNGCRNVTAGSSQQACQGVEDLRATLRRAEDGESLERQVADLRKSRDALPAVVDPDEHFARVADLLNALSPSVAGVVDVAVMRLATIMQIALQTELLAAVAVAIALTFLKRAWAAIRAPD